MSYTGGTHVRVRRHIGHIQAKKTGQETERRLWAILLLHIQIYIDKHLQKFSVFHLLFFQFFFNAYTSSLAKFPGLKLPRAFWHEKTSRVFLCSTRNIYCTALKSGTISCFFVNFFGTQFFLGRYIAKIRKPTDLLCRRAYYHKVRGAAKNRRNLQILAHFTLTNGL